MRLVLLLLLLLCGDLTRSKTACNRYIAENGMDTSDETLSPSTPLRDAARIEFLGAYLASLSEAITKHHIDVRGYYTWYSRQCCELGSGARRSVETAHAVA